MATSISTQADLKAAWLILPSEIERLTTTEMESDNWATVHEAAWTAVKTDLYMRRDKIQEDDLDDTSELLNATLYYVLHIAYRVSEIEDDVINSKKWYRRYAKELGEIELSVSGGTTARSAEQAQARIVRG